MRALGFDVKKPEVIKMVHGMLITLKVSRKIIFFIPFYPTKTDVDPSNAGSVDYDQFLEISTPQYFIILFKLTMNLHLLYF